MATETVLIRKELPTYAYLIVARGRQAGTIFQLRPDVTTVGRGPENDLRLEDPAVSTRHLRIRCDDGKRFTLIDQGTPNGTRINGRQDQQCVLDHNDVIHLGDTTLVFKQVAAAPIRR